MIRRTAVAGLAGLGLVGGAGAVAYNSDGTATVKITDERTGVERTVQLEGRGKTFSCPQGTEEKVSPHDIKLGRIDLTIRQVRRQERKLEAKYPDGTAPGPVVDRYDAQLRRDKRLVRAYNSTVDTRNAIIDADCE